VTRKWEEMEALVMSKLEENTKTLNELKTSFYEYQRTTDKAVVVLQTKLGMLSAGVSAVVSIVTKYLLGG